MSFVNYRDKEINFKIVYYGPGLSGKTTSIERIYDRTKGKNKSKMMRQENNERTLFFDFIPLTIEGISGYKTRFHLYTVPGQPLYEDSRRLILKGVDGIMFVADSEIDKMESNLQALESLKNNLKEEGYHLESIPIVVQYNKRDSKKAVDLDALKKIVNPSQFPEFQTVALKDEGVFDAFKCLAKAVLRDYSEHH